MVANHGSELVVIVRIRIQAFEAPIVFIPALGRLAGWQIHRSHKLTDDISPTEDALVGQKMKPLLPLVIDHATPWRLLVCIHPSKATLFSDLIAC
jgi:hypothetical protein